MNDSVHEIFEIDGTQIGRDQPCYIIAEIGINHNGDIEIAKKLIDSAIQIGANAVKFQKRNLESQKCSSYRSF